MTCVKLQQTSGRQVRDKAYDKYIYPLPYVFILFIHLVIDLLIQNHVDRSRILMIRNTIHVITILSTWYELAKSCCCTWLPVHPVSTSRTSVFAVPCLTGWGVNILSLIHKMWTSRYQNVQGETECMLKPVIHLILSNIAHCTLPVYILKPSKWSSFKIKWCLDSWVN